MTIKSLSNLILADGEYEFLEAVRPGREIVFEISGTFGSGTATFGFRDAAGAFQSFKDANGTAQTATANAVLCVTVPASGVLAVKLAGATTPSLSAAMTKVPV
jgi:hypothetical protein